MSVGTELTTSEIAEIMSLETVKLLDRLGKFAVDRSLKIYSVGGFVRDLLLGRKTLDLDFSIEGDAIKFAQELSKFFGGNVKIYSRFGTATLTLADSSKIDFVTARSETYRSPGALPAVTSSSINSDLFRRDFSINAIALSIIPENFGKIIDPTNGINDLKSKRIRVLHDRSFIDDATRIFRAIRYEQRYDFSIDDKTQKLLREAISGGYLDRVGKFRIRNELNRCRIEEAQVLRSIIKRMKQFDLFEVISPELCQSLEVEKC